jgi:hypothetical protein
VTRLPSGLARGVGEIGVPLVAVIGPGDVLFDQPVSDGVQGRRRNREHGFVGVADVGVGVGAAAAAVVSGVVIVEQIVVTLFTV